MIDIKLIRENPEQVRERAAKKGVVVRVDEILRLDHQRRRLLTRVNGLR
ncbi:MAG: serine--tRNA ligase, partial [Candidatus Latescibacteria bacterium]|nr:serine--tRNA ligase [Candidatus Latescibacterota bacterium]